MHLGGTQTAEALHAMRTNLFDPQNGARVNSPKIAFIITDGKSYEPDATNLEAKLVS